MPIVTLTMNPAIDSAARTERVLPTDKMRCSAPRFDPGGGGINVARTVAALGEPVTAIYPAGGHTGVFLEQLVRAANIPSHAVATAEPSRENLAVFADDTGEQYRFVFPGPRLTPAEQHRCLAAVEHCAPGADYVVASGSLPPGVESDYYQILADVAAAHGVPMILDTSGAALRAIRRGVFLIKPSVRELAQLVGRALPDREAQAAAARELVHASVAEVVVVSLGAEGVLAVTAERSQWFAPIPVPVRSGIGAGDAMVGGITVGLTRGYELDDAIRLGIAAATAALTTSGTAPGLRSRIEQLYEEQTRAAAPVAEMG
ncbi:phosphofructokinase [Nocardia sp. 852002-20019_SCH5090214]|uniref:1-phosphofructokinase family hexose kinase n=1 Tax=Nocardia TaxID=1817 RepID=UPI0007E94DDC|nr:MULTISPECIES: 1-phosphofructokinase family hexose kinase [Nocardia]OBA46916.1 phosphofructokinase [Nocardia sp. 852002-20019_SCH5090214]PPJ13412.1 phosphofructokinase [Nocardia nova]